MVKNLMVDGSIAAKNAASVGGIAAFLYGGSITNCENRVTINLTTESDANNFHAGGIVGYVYGDKGGDGGFGSSTVDSCSNSGSIDVVATVSGCIGGIAGALGDADRDVAPDCSEGTIRLCQNSGEIRVTECKNNTWVGGIIGIGTGGSLTNCYNSGAVICTADKNGRPSFVGGVIGSSGDFTNEGDDASDYAISISACENGGAVCATDTNAGYSSAWAGGIAGFSYGAISNAANTGRVQGQGMAGGIVGVNMPAAVSNCYNWGDVIDNGSDITRLLTTLLALVMLLPIVAQAAPTDGWTDEAEQAYTAETLTALAPYADKEYVAKAIDAGLEYLSSVQLADGSFANMSKETPDGEVTLAVLKMMEALDISLEDERFVKNGNTVADAMQTFYVDGVGFISNFDVEAPLDNLEILPRYDNPNMGVSDTISALTYLQAAENGKFGPDGTGNSVFEIVGSALTETPLGAILLAVIIVALLAFGIVRRYRRIKKEQ